MKVINSVNKVITGYKTFIMKNIHTNYEVCMKCFLCYNNNKSVITIWVEKGEKNE